MSEHNPLVLYHQLRDTLRRYIPTTLPISRTYPQLRQAFRDLVNEREHKDNCIYLHTKNSMNVFRCSSCRV